jgi:hypothetical protein
MVQLKNIQDIWEAHQHKAIKASKKVRKWDGSTPYSLHPLWCATTIATETSLDNTTREEGALTLLYHDVLEDTTGSIAHLPKRIQTLIEHMTFPGGSAQEMQEIWAKPKEVRLYKLYDKVSNLLDGAWMSDKKKIEYKVYTQKLCTDVEEEYTQLNITTITRGILR